MFLKSNRPVIDKSPIVSNSNKKLVPTIISQEMNIMGNLISDGPINVDGRIEGNIQCGIITVGESGKIRGDIIAEVAHVHGDVSGLIKAKEVHLYAACRVEGSIMHESLSIEDGAFVDGKFKRMDKLSLRDTPMEDSRISLIEDSQDSLETLEKLRLVS